LPGTAESIQYAFECDCSDEESGTNTTESAQALDSRTVEEQVTDSDRWKDGF
jgi:hypothetical protein